MKRFVRAWAVAALAVGVGTGCADEQEALIVLHSVVGEFVTAEACSFDPEGGSELSRGNLDVLGGTAYTLAPVLLNNLPSRGANSTNSGVDDSELQLRDVDISVHLPRDLADAIPADIPRSYTLAIATDSLSPGERYAAIVDVIQPEMTRAFAEVVSPEDDFEISVDIVYHATRTGNTKGDVGVIDSRLYTFPIHLCAGCMLIDCSECEGGVCPSEVQDHFGRLCGNAQDSSPPPPPENCPPEPEEVASTGLPPSGSTDSGASSGGSSG